MAKQQRIDIHERIELRVKIKKLQKENAVLCERLKPIKEVYEHYKGKNIVHDLDYLHDTREMMEEILIGRKGSYCYKATTKEKT